MVAPNLFLEIRPMQTEALLATSRRGEELRYVTEHFRDLQGLRTASAWASLLALCGAAMAPPLVHWHLPGIALAIVLLNIGWLFWSGGWYRRRYGVVTSPERAVPSGIISIMNPEIRPRAARSGYLPVSFLLLALYSLPMFFRRFNAIHAGQSGLLAVALILLPRCFYAAPANGLIRLRRLFTIAGSIAICAIYLNYLFARVGKWPYLAAICATLLLLDLYDHWLLTRLLSGGASAEASHE
jgi:hypothetical protein